MLINRASRVAGELRVPGDKAISHRALLIGAGVPRAISVSGLSPAADVASSLRAIREMGAIVLGDRSNPPLKGFEPSESGLGSLKLEGKSSWDGLEAPKTLDCGNSGTTMRMLMGILAGGSSHTTLVGDDSLTGRPMARVADPLRSMGAHIDLSTNATAPVVIHPSRLVGINYSLPMASAQVKTALMFAGMRAEGVTTISEPGSSRDHTERMLRFFGFESVRGDGLIEVRKTELFGDKEINIPGDISSASFLLTAAAILPGSDLTIHDVGLNPTRTAYLDILRSFGAIVETSAVREISGEPRGTVRVQASDMRPIEVGAAQVPSAIDELPLVAVLGAFAEGETVLSGAAELRVKESDRIAAMEAGLRRMGVRIDSTPDGFVVRGPARMTGAEVDPVGDHRVAMALAIAGLGAEGDTYIRGAEVVGVSYPRFEADLTLIVEH